MHKVRRRRRGYTSSSSGIRRLYFGRLEGPFNRVCQAQASSSEQKPTRRLAAEARSAAAMAGLCSCSLHSLLNPPPASTNIREAGGGRKAVSWIAPRRSPVRVRLAPKGKPCSRGSLCSRPWQLPMASKACSYAASWLRAGQRPPGHQPRGRAAAGKDLLCATGCVVAVSPRARMTLIGSQIADRLRRSCESGACPLRPTNSGSAVWPRLGSPLGGPTRAAPARRLSIRHRRAAPRRTVHAGHPIHLCSSGLLATSSEARFRSRRPGFVSVQSSGGTRARGAQPRRAGRRRAS